MESDPKKPIEQMLEALAKARRAEFGEDPKMPNPMRARLHDEIARTEAADDENAESRESWVTRFWPRVTVAAALATLMVLLPAIWWNRSHPVAGSGDLALRERAAGAANTLNPEAAAEGTLAKAPAVNLADNSQIKVEPAAQTTSEAEALRSSSGLAEGRGATESQSQVMKDFVDKKVAAAKIQAAPAAAPAGGADSKTESDSVAAAAPPVSQPSLGDGLKTRQQFSQRSAVQSFRNNAQVSRAANVLNTFQVQQQGNEIRVLDADGSTYTGKIEQSGKGAELSARVTARRDTTKQKESYAAAKAAGESASAGAQSYFRATGYNLSLKKTLVFEGNYAMPEPQQPATEVPGDRERAEQGAEQARIVGTVRVNGEAPIRVDAISETTEPAESKKTEK